MKKICYVVTLPLTVRAFFIPQLKYLAHNGFDVSVVCSADPQLQEELGENIRFLPVEMPRGLSVLGSLKAIGKLRKLFREESFDLIQYSTPNAAFYASFAAKRAGCRNRNYHLMGLRYLGASGLSRKILKALEKLSCRNSTTVECVSKSNLELGVEEKLFPREKATVVWNGSTGGIDLGRFDGRKREEYRAQIRKQYGIGEEFLYGFVGRITRDKGVNEILEAFTQISDGKLMMVGNPECTQSLDQKLYALSQRNPRIIYTGAVSDVERYYAAVDVLLLPSYREGFGNVVIEAAAMGTPAIVSRIPGPVDTVMEGKTALTVPVKDVESLVCCMRKIREPECAQMGANARAFVCESFDSEKLNGYILARKEALLEQ